MTLNDLEQLVINCANRRRVCDFLLLTIMSLYCIVYWILPTWLPLWPWKAFHFARYNIVNVTEALMQLQW